MQNNAEVVNQLLVQTFNEILKVEEVSLRHATKNRVTVTEMHTMAAIGAEEPRTITALAAANMVTISTMTIAINRLEKKGFVQRMRESTDKRMVHVHLTDQGRIIADAHRLFHRRMADAILDRLTPEQAKALVPALQNLCGFFNEENMSMVME